MDEEYRIGLEPNAANYAPLTPLVFLDWCADVYPDRVAIVPVYADRRIAA